MLAEPAPHFHLGVGGSDLRSLLHEVRAVLAVTQYRTAPRSMEHPPAGPAVAKTNQPCASAKLP
eukprot:1158795-Pelagomonas_calceolata.AAC.5